MLLREIAHARTGDKGKLVTISLIAYRREDYALLEEHVTIEAVASLFASLLDGPNEKDPVQRYELPHLGALNFVLRRAESANVTRSLALDAHGKCLGSALLGMEI